MNSSSVRQWAKYIGFFVAVWLGGMGIGRLTIDPVVVTSQEALEDLTIVQRLIGRDSNESDVNFNVFWDVWDVIEDSYARQPIDQQAMMEGAIAGMLRALDDPHTSYLSLDEADLFSEDLDGYVPVKRSYPFYGDIIKKIMKSEHGEPLFEV